MHYLPKLIMHFHTPDEQERTNLDLKLVLSPNTADSSEDYTDSCLLTLPFHFVQIPLILRALNARQYPDYPTHERLIEHTEDRVYIVNELRALGLWEGSDEKGAVSLEVHTQVGEKLGKALLVHNIIEIYLNKLYNAAITAGGGQLVLHFDAGASALAALPWEVAHAGTQPILLTRGVALNCVRMFAFAHPLPLPLCSNERLRILTIAPRVLMDEVGNTFQELAQMYLQQALKDLDADIEVLSSNTIEHLYQRLSQKPTINVLNYFGHGTFTNQRGALLLEPDLN